MPCTSKSAARGLLSSTPRQIYLQRQLSLKVPDYTHLPLVLNHQREKLSKQTGAPALDRHRPGPALIAALRFLNQDPPLDLVHEHPPAILAWALQNWRIERILAPLSNPFTHA
jgi:glutamyl-Q tRNA(Asp) synthetase